MLKLFKKLFSRKGISRTRVSEADVAEVGRSFTPIHNHFQQEKDQEQPALRALEIFAHINI